MLSILTWYVCLMRTERIACFSIQQSVLRAGLFAFLGDWDRYVVTIGVEFQNNVHGRKLVLGAKGNGVFTGGKTSRLGRVGSPFIERFQVAMV